MTFEVFPIPVGEFENHPPLPAENEAERVVGLLGQVGGTARPWDPPAQQRDKAGVGKRLGEWVGPRELLGSVVVWLGHGSSDGDRAWLACYETSTSMSDGSGLGTQDVVDRIVAERVRRAGEPESWAIVAIEACGAKRFVSRLAAELYARPDTPERLALIGVGGEGSGNLGQLSQSLEAALDSYTDNDDTIRIKDLADRLEQRVEPGVVVRFAVHKIPPIPRPRTLPTTVNATQDVYDELQAFLAGLPADERGHFVPKAQGAEQGELAWYFVGRTRERREVSRWLREADAGMLVVTGRAGSGKSALLGNVLVHGNPELRDLLLRAKHLEEIPAADRPPDAPFDAVVHLTGVTAAEAVERFRTAADLPPPKDSAEVSERIETLLTGLRERERRFTVLADALDEAQDPATVAGAVLRRVAALPTCRVVVGTRVSTKEGPDQPPPDTDLLDALGGTDRMTVVTVERDPDAVADYVTLRLARLDGATQEQIDDVADLVRGLDREFLFARLAVHEVLARPELLDARDELTELLSGDHRGLFGAAVRRITADDPTALPLLEALALARGRGAPRADRIWATMAAALAEDAPVTDVDIERLLRTAAPYVMLDAEDGQSVYRLAHQTFREYFLERWRQ
jgi:hypothetical protein